MLKIILNCLINYFCPQKVYIQNLEYDEIYFKELLTKSKKDYINS